MNKTIFVKLIGFGIVGACLTMYAYLSGGSEKDVIIREEENGTIDGIVGEEIATDTF